MTKPSVKKTIEAWQMLGIILAVAGTLVGGAWKIDTTFARSAEVNKQIGETKVLFLDNQARSLEKEQYELESVVEDGGKLTPREKGRLDAVKKDLQRIKDQIKMLEGK